MHKDAHGTQIVEGNHVRILQVQSHWFNYLPPEAYQVLQNACAKPLKVEYLDDDGRLSLVLPPTLEEDGDYVGNSLTIESEKVELVYSPSTEKRP